MITRIYCLSERLDFLTNVQRLLQTIQMKLLFLFVWAEPAVLGSAKTALKFKYEI